MNLEREPDLPRFMFSPVPADAVIGPEEIRKRWRGFNAKWLDEVDLSYRARTRLRLMGFRRVGEVRVVRDSHLLKCPGFGRKTLNEVRLVIPGARRRSPTSEFLMDRLRQIVERTRAGQCYWQMDDME